MAGYRGLISCDAAHFLTGVCISFSILTIMTFILMVLGIILLLQRFKRSSQLFKRKQILLFLLILTCLTYIPYNIQRDYVYFFILEYYFYFCYQTYLLYYYSRKAVRGNSQRLYALMVQGLAAVMFIFFSIEMIVHSVIYFRDRTFKICTDDQISPLRATAFFMQILFCFTGKFLERKFTMQSQDIFASLTEEERTEYCLNVVRYYEKCIRRLIIVNMIGATLLFAENILFVARKGSGCRLFPHYGPMNENNWSDNLNSLFNSLIQLFTIQIPFALTLKIFQLPRLSKVNKLSEDFDQYPSIVNATFFKGLRLSRTNKYNSQEEISNKHSPSDSD